MRSTPGRRPHQGAKVICFQELFYGPYFCQVQDAKCYSYAESVPGPTIERFQALAARARHGDGAADVRAGAARRALQHRGRARRRRQLPRQVPQDPHPAGQAASGRSSTSARATSGYPVVRHRGRPDRRLHLLRPALPGGLAGARAERRADRVQPVGDQPRPVRLPVEAGAAGRPRWPTSTSSARSTGSASRISATTTSTAPSYFVDPEGKFVGDVGADAQLRADRPRPGHGPARRGARPLGSSTATAAPTPTTTW